MLPSWLITIIVGVSFFLRPHRVTAYSVPPIRFITLQPKGFEVSIPVSDGVTMFAFHGKLNAALGYREAGTWSRDVNSTENNRYTFRDTTTKLKAGDIINYWVYVMHDGLGYERDFLQFTVPAVTCSFSETKLIDETPCGDKLIFEENFDTLDPSKWLLEQRFTKEPDFEFGIYANTSNTISVDGSQLKIKPVRLVDHMPLDSIDFGVDCTGELSTPECTPSADEIRSMAPIASAQISTLDSFSFIYGRLEIRARLPRSKWVFPQIHLRPTDSVYGAHDYASGQIRMAHYIHPGFMTGGLILGSMPPFRQSNMCTKAFNLTDEFHVFSTLWTPENVTLSIDDVAFCVSTQPLKGYRNSDEHPPGEAKWTAIGGQMAPFDRPFHLTLGVGVGGLNDYPDSEYPADVKPWRNDDRQAAISFWRSVQPDKQWPERTAQLSVDYVRVYSLSLRN